MLSIHAHMGSPWLEARVVNPVLFIQLTVLIVSLTLSTIFFMAWHQMGKKRYILIWAITFLVMSVQRLFNIIKPEFPSLELYWMVVVFMSLATVYGGAWGHALRTQSKFNFRWLLGAMAVVYFITFYTTVIVPHVGMRMSLYVAFNSVVMVAVGGMIYTYRQKPLPAEIGTAVSYVAFALIQFAAAIFAFLQGDNFDPIFGEIYIYLNFVTMPAAFTAMGLFTVYIVASDLSEEMKLAAITDPLTNVLNRRGFYEVANEKLKSPNKNTSMGLIYWDIDHFKAINDKYGHSTGDNVLIEVVTSVCGKLKDTDVIGRLGGEEFVVLVMTDKQTSLVQFAEQLRTAIANQTFVHQDNEFEVTASFGVVDISDKSSDLDQLIDCADRALYNAKNNGRNKVFKDQ